MSKLGNNLALALGFRGNARNTKAIRAVTVITTHEDTKYDTSESWAASDIQDVREDITYLTQNIRSRTISITVLEDR